MNLKKEDGFTLIEILVALAIVSIVSMAFFATVNMTTKYNAKNEKDIQSMDVAQSEIEYLTKEIKSNKKTIDIDFNDNGQLEETDNSSNECISKKSIKDKGFDNFNGNPKYIVKYEGNENTKYQVFVKIDTQEKKQQIKDYYLYNIEIKVKSLSNLSERESVIKTSVLDNGN
ncbi:PulJ/GspJ family protein [Paraclostridium bifermentans]|uniref:PulJ/GspJ family protein n=1 Tax=Paraclostridium bifermentans TaxID=1490 RepID=UPI00359C5181